VVDIYKWIDASHDQGLANMGETEPGLRANSSRNNHLTPRKRGEPRLNLSLFQGPRRKNTPASRFLQALNSLHV
jgi:hypothetical protein